MTDDKFNKYRDDPLRVWVPVEADILDTHSSVVVEGGQCDARSGTRLAVTYISYV